jgi:two-component system, repressor protein LuxO
MASGRSPQPVDVIIVDADASQRRALAGMIAERSLGRFLAHACASESEALNAGAGGNRAIVIADLETIGGAARLSDLAGGEYPLIATSVSGSLTTAVAAMRAGATDFLPKPIGAKALLERLEAALAGAPFRGKLLPGDKRDASLPLDEGRNLRRAKPASKFGEGWESVAPSSASRPTAEPDQRDEQRTDFAGFIGRSPAMAAVYEQIKRMAPSRAPVFVTGESGTGKEVCAEAIHQYSGPPGRPFVAINCSAIPRDLMESEIFGHVRGAFTGAAENRAGAAELANGGTLFLDEIAEMDLSLQAKLLRFVQTGTIRRVGGTELIRVDVRIVCATNRDPFAEVEAGRFRADLFYRLHVLPIELAPLRARPEDVMPLALAFLKRFSAEEGRAFYGFAPEAEGRIMACAWPGNVRQLENAIRRIVVLHDGGVVRPEMLPAELAAATPVTASPATPQPATAILPFRLQEQVIIEAAVAAFGGNVGRAAAALEISPSTIYRKRQEWMPKPAHHPLHEIARD